MAKNLVIVESPAKAKTLSKYLGRDYDVKASVGHVVDLPKSKLGVDIENDFAPEYTIIRGKAKVISDLKAGGQGQGKHLPGPRPRPRGGGDRLAHRPEAATARSANIRRVLFNEITKKRGPGGDQAPGRDRSEPLRGAADAAHPRPPGRLPDQPAAVGQGAARAVGRPRAVGGGAHRLRARARDPRLSEEGILVDHGAARGRESAARSPRGCCASASERLDPEKFRIENEAAATELVDDSLRGRRVQGHQGRAQGATPLSDAAVHHLATAAGGVAQARLHPVADDAHRAAALRGHRARRRGAGRTDHLHAHRFDARVAGSRGGGARLHRRALRATTTCRRSRSDLQDQEGRAGRARSDPADRARATAGSGCRATSARRSWRSTR